MKLKTQNSKLKILLAALCLGVLVVNSRASLTAVVTPGYQFPADGSVPPTYSLLNLLAQPTVTITGTVGGSNTLAPGSITTVSFAQSVVDGATIGFNGNSPAGLQVLAAGIAGPGLTNSGLTNLALNVDTNYFVLSTNTPSNNYTNPKAMLTFKTNLTALMTIDTNVFALATNSPANTNSPPLTNAVQLVLRGFMSTNINLSSSGGLLASIPHGLGLTPSSVRVVLVNITNELGYTANMELSVESSRNPANGTYPVFMPSADSTNVYLTLNTTTAAQGIYINNRTTGVGGSINYPNWQAKIYARP
jgi:hypothetical protein